MRAPTDPSAEPPAARPGPPPLGEAVRAWTKVGLLGFGGPAGQIALMHRVFVDEKRWLSEDRYLHALSFCMLLPGPEAQQLATYVGWLVRGVSGAVLAGTLFILPGALVILGLAVVYHLYGELPLVEALFYGVRAVVVAVVVDAVWRMGGRVLTSTRSRAFAVTAFIALFVFNAPFPLVVLAAGLAGWLMRGAGASESAAREAAEAPDPVPGHLLTWRRGLRVTAIIAVLWLGPVVLITAALGSGNVFSQIGVFFSTMAMVTFGGAYAVLAYVAQQAVEVYGWLSAGEMLDGLGLAETTPGPLILVVEFVGYLAAARADPGVAAGSVLMGSLGAALTLWVTFVPSFLWILVGAPHMERLRDNAALTAALSGIMAAIVGVMANLALWLTLHVVFADIGEVSAGPVRITVPEPASLDVAALVLGVAALVAMTRFKAGVVAVLLAGAAAGAGLHLMG